MVFRFLQNLFKRKTRLNPVYINYLSSWYEFGVTRSDLNGYQDASVCWALEMLKLENPNEFIRIAKRCLRYHRLSYTKSSLKHNPELVGDLNIENDTLAPYMKLYDRIVAEKRARGIIKFRPQAIE